MDNPICLVQISYVVVPICFYIFFAKNASMDIKSFLIVDFKDISNWVTLLIAIPLLWWGFSTIISAAKGG